MEFVIIILNNRDSLISEVISEGNSTPARAIYGFGLLRLS